MSLNNCLSGRESHVACDGKNLPWWSTIAGWDWLQSDDLSASDQRSRRRGRRTKPGRGAIFLCEGVSCLTFDWAWRRGRDDGDNLIGD